MRKPVLLAGALALATFAAVSPAGAVSTTNTRMLSEPAIGGGRIVFAYANDLWTAGLDGRDVRRLTTDPGTESGPVVSPDGSLIAFSGQYDGNLDVYVVPAGGGVPKRLTWHPGPDLVQGFTPDGKSVIFTSSRESYTSAYFKLFTVPVEGGLETRMDLPYAWQAAVSPDGRFIAYDPFPEAFIQWKHYRGGRNSRIWIFDRTDRSVVKVPQPEARCNDVSPMWAGGRVLFLSDRDGEFNLYAFDPAGKSVAALTAFKDFPILSASTDGARVAFERAGTLHLFDLKTSKVNDLAIGVAADLPELRPRFARGAQWIRSGSLSPTGARAVVDFRGEIVTIPAEKGDPRNLTNTPAVHEKNPVWSYDGKSIAYFSDASGEYALVVEPQDGRGAGKTYKLNGSGFYGSLAWAPDGKKMLFADNGLSLYWMDLATGAIRKIGAEHTYQPGGQAEVPSTWSPDSRWIAYTLSTPTFFRRLFVYSVAEDKSYPVTDGLSDVADPAFDRGGKYLFFLASTDAGPARQWFDMSNADVRQTFSMYAAVLRKDLPNPFARESDEEKPAAAPEEKKEPLPAAGAKAGGDKAAAAKNEAAKPGADKAKAAEAAKTPDIGIDFEGISSRIVAVPIPSGVYSSLQAGEGGKIFYLQIQLPDAVDSSARPVSTLHVFDMATRKDEVLAPNVDGFMISADGKKMLLVSRGTFSIVAAGAKPEPGKGRLNVEAIEVKVDPQAEWRQIFGEAWRIQRDYFYDPKFQGCDWPAMRTKYEPFLNDVACRADLNRVIQWMCSELAVGHHRVGGGDMPGASRAVPGGLLGADYEVADGRYRFQKVYGGLNWTPDLRSPLTEPGVDVKAGDYLLAVEGRDLKPPENLFARFENTAGKIVEITVGPNADGKGARTLQVVPVPSESALRNRDWVEGNLQKVQEATGGRVAYVYVPNTSTLGYIYFKRYFFPQAAKDAIIVDERFNGGGSVADYYIDWLKKPVVAYWAMRYGADLKTPTASIQGPKVLLVNEMAGSGGDLFPFMWRKFGMGKMVGTRTWGGLVGILGFPELLDGGFITAPNLAFWTEDGFGIENVGVPPDIEVEMTPKDVLDGHDPQLEKAIQVIMDELKANPPQAPKKPAFPNRMK